ncbi:VapE domain-containing protein [Bacteroides sp. GD17]|jgi:hypothetical protein|uniref:VapE domain-containing protein n=1 Tax=Bacteroides sp. GD17 TaxID=3139826 RepID=UPI0025E15E72|nr:VapE domain-containing protein [uncultured Bacteroides sp.]
MEDITITLHKGFSAVAGKTSLKTIIEEVRNGKHAATIQRIVQQAEKGMKKEAEKLKRTLPYLSLTANYEKERLPYSIAGYNPVITIDIDGLKTEQIKAVRKLLEADPDILAAFLSPKQHGFKVFVYLRTAYACKLRETTFSTREIGYTELEKYHAQMYEATRVRIEQLTGVKVDTSGSDISRGFFESYDPEAYLNEALLAAIPDYNLQIVPPEKTVRPRKKRASVSPTSATQVEPWEMMEYRKALSTTKRSDKFVEGNRDNFLYILGNRCYRKGIKEESACLMIQKDFGNQDLNVLDPVHNAYSYTSKTEAAEKAKEEKQPVINQVMDFLEEHYGIRRNIVLDRLEFMPYDRPEEARKGYRPMRIKDYNSIFVDLQMAGISCFQNFLKAVIDSNYAKDFNPFLGYLDNLPSWDGTDYIRQLADTIQTENQELWREGFRKWIVGMVACAIRDKDMNQLVPILYSEQGKGKSTWIRNLLPPEWKEYFYNGMVDPANKDHAQLLSTRLIINMEEFEGVKPGELANLKRFITQENVTQRKAYDFEAFTFIRHASFIGSTNNRQCLQDVGGNRRFLPITIRQVDYRTPVNHAGVYSQALALLESGFRYWYEGEEIEQLNKHNELHRMKDPVEENLFVFFRKPLPEDLNVRWMPAAAILTKLNVFGKVPVTQHAQQVLVQALEKYGFRTRINEQDTTEYELVDIQQDDVENNFKEPNSSQKKTEGGKGTEEENKLPF